MKRFLGMAIAVIGVVSLVFGILFIIQSNTGKQTVADEINPIALSDLNTKYDSVKASQIKVMAAEEPQIQAGKAAPTVMYDYLSAQRALLAEAKSNVALAGFVMMSGVVDIILGLGLIIVGAAFYQKQTA